MMAEPDDTTLVHRSLAGDKTAVSQLLQRHQARVRQVLRAMLANPADVEDLLQEAFLRAYLGLDELRQPERFRAWLCSIAINLARMHLRAPAQRWLSWQEMEALQVHIADRHPAPEQLAEERERAQRLHEALNDIPPSERDALLLVYWQGMSHRETAVSLGTSVAAIKVRVHRGRSRLQTALQAEYGLPLRQETKEDKMIPVRIYDVLVRVTELDPRPHLQPVLELLPDEFHRELLAGISLSMEHDVKVWEMIQKLPDARQKAVQKALAPFLSHHVVLLQEEDEKRVLPIWIGRLEAEAIVLKLRNQFVKRPITHDLLTTLLDLSGVQVTQATVSRLHEMVFYSTLTLSLGADGEAEVDCRPSDALSLAVRLETPLLVAADVMVDQGVLPDTKGRYAFAQEIFPGPAWRSLL